MSWGDCWDGSDHADQGSSIQVAISVVGFAIGAHVKLVFLFAATLVGMFPVARCVFWP